MLFAKPGKRLTDIFKPIGNRRGDLTCHFRKLAHQAMKHVAADAKHFNGRDSPQTGAPYLRLEQGVLTNEIASVDTPRARLTRCIMVKQNGFTRRDEISRVCLAALHKDCRTRFVLLARRREGKHLQPHRIETGKKRLGLQKSDLSGKAHGFSLVERDERA